MKTIKHLLLLLAVCAPLLSHAQEDAPFNGILLDKTGEPVRRAMVWVDDATRYALTDRRGRFGLTGVAGNDTLNVKVKRRIYRIAVDGKKAVRIHLADYSSFETEEDLEIADLGYGFVKRRELTSASSGISGEELRRSGAADILTALQGRVPGLYITGNSFDGKSVNIRGINSFMADSTPLFIVDGTIVGSLDGVNVYDVDYVEVMKDASIYGSRGANGAIIVHTKKGPAK